MLILTPYLYRYLSDPSQMFHICFYVWICERNQLGQKTQKRLKLMGSSDLMSNKITITKTKELMKHFILNEHHVLKFIQ